MEEWFLFHKGYYVWNVDPGYLAELLTQHLNKAGALPENDRKKLRDLLESIDENDNNYLFYGKLRQTETFSMRNAPSK